MHSQHHSCDAVTWAYLVLDWCDVALVPPVDTVGEQDVGGGEIGGGIVELPVTDVARVHVQELTVRLKHAGQTGCYRTMHSNIKYM